MTEPAYVSIAGEYARKIRGEELPAGIQLPSYAEIASRYGVSDIVVRKAIELLQNQGLVHAIRRRGVFVTAQPNLVRVSPERQLESAESTFDGESSSTVQVERFSDTVVATAELADAFSVEPGATLSHVVTRASEDARPISISDTFQPEGFSGIAGAKFLEETIADRLPTPSHAEWLRATPGDLVKTVHQKFSAADGRVLMVSDISYPRDRYESFVFRMVLDS
ncbi:GntR family transcriptional regulator [Amycolatopsis sp. CA-128772]|uniref:GntR family transcriptional regulator n=1 Tax=Amycolatopsis sp. CA-128772 TaxID=2073159 RepID=UPI000CCFEC34|nr:GntR family transcriptional regulator [Amycolatopsis sp. CA-128772]